MKKILSAVICLLPFATIAQSNYTITGNLPQLKTPAKAYLVTWQTNAYKETDSAVIKNGKFQFKGTVAEPQQAILAVKRTAAAGAKNDRDYKDFFLENSKIAFTGTDSIKNAKVNGSVADKEKEELAAQTMPLTRKIIKIQNDFTKDHKPNPDKTAAERKAASDSIASYVAQIKNINLKFVEAHTQSFMGLYTFNNSILGSKFNPAEVTTLFNRFSPELQASDLGKKVADRIEVAKRGQAGVKVTDFTQNDVNGKPFTLSSLRGKYVLVDFWASWCGPCRAENPNVRKAYQALKDKNFEIVSVSLDSGKAPWVEAINKDGMPWIHVCDFKGWKNDVALLYGVSSVPQNFLIDPKGVIIARDLRGEDLTQKLSALLK